MLKNKYAVLSSIRVPTSRTWKYEWTVTQHAEISNNWAATKVASLWMGWRPQPIKSCVTMIEYYAIYTLWDQERHFISDHVVYSERLSLRLFGWYCLNADWCTWRMCFTSPENTRGIHKNSMTLIRKYHSLVTKVDSITKTA